MKFILPDANDLIYFSETAITENLSRASERLGITQPALSISIQRLERSIGSSLFIRTKKGVHLTQAGKFLYAQSRNLIQQWQQVRTKAIASTELIQGQYTLGCHPSVALYTLPLLLPKILEAHPGIEIRLEHALSRRIVESVISMEIDLGIVINPIRNPNLVIRKLADDEVCFWVGEGNSQIQNPQSGNAVLICDLELVQTQALLKKLKVAGIKYGRVLHTASLELITELTLSGAGIGIIPSRVANPKKNKGLRKLSKSPVFRDEISLIYRVENRAVKTIQLFSETLSHVFT